MNPEVILKIFSTNLPTLGVLCLIGGIVKIFVYYKLFGIYIFPFIDIKEVISLFISNLLGFFIVLVYAALIITNSILEIIYIPAIFCGLSFIYWILRKNVLFYEFLLINGLLWGIYGIAQWLLTSYAINQGMVESLTNWTLFFFMLSLIVYSIVSSLSEFYKVKWKRYYYYVDVFLDDNERITNQDRNFIGKTQNFLFIYDFKEKRTEIYSSTKIAKVFFNEVGRKRHFK
jgi:hypothetical protein